MIEERSLRLPQTALPSPVSAPASASQRRFSKAGRKQSNGSVQSSSSSGTGKSVEGAGIRQPAKSKIRRHSHRLSSVFTRSLPRGRGEMAGAAEQPMVTDDPSELSNHVTAPGVLKIFGNEICEGANYKSVLATTTSSAKELVKEALERYSLNKAEADSYVLCDVIGCVGEHQWRTECVRVVGDNEKPLLLQSLWKPREGYSRRFEIQWRASIEEKNSKEKDTVTAGINAQARRLQRTRVHGRSVLLDQSACGIMTDGGPSLWRSLSETDLAAEAQGPRQSCQNCQWQGEDSDAEAHKDGQCLANEREETESSDDNSTQYSIHPPFDFPYLLLLQGYSYRQDFVLYAVNGSCTVFGRRHGPQGSTRDRHGADVQLWAPDILPHHCCVRRCEPPPRGAQRRPGRAAPCVTVLKPVRGAAVKLNGVALEREAPLRPGDVVGLGDHYLFLFKDPTASAAGTPPTAAAVPWGSGASRTGRGSPLCKTCLLSGARTQHKSTGRPCLKDGRGRELLLAYDEKQEGRILKEIFDMEKQGGQAHGLSPAFLLCLCLQRSATHFPMPDLRRLLLQIASEVQTAVWERAKELAAMEPDTGDGGCGGQSPEEVGPLRLENLIPGLQPLVLWMASSVELLHFIQQEVPGLLHGLSQEEEEEEEDCMAVLELRLSSVRSASEEAMTVLEEVIMFTFQQCVYYLTKTLYPVLQGFLESNPFSESGQLHVPKDVASVLGILKGAARLLKDSQVHEEVALQLFTYLFFFINAFLFNSLMERGSGGCFYQWARGVQIRANLDLLMDWADSAGLGDLAQGYLLKLSSAVNLLATPKENLLQASWPALRAEFASLNPAQLHHMLREYNPRRPCPSAWTPPREESSAALTTADILESFDKHPPISLPWGGFLLELKRPITESRLLEQHGQLQEFCRNLTAAESALPAQVDSAIPMQAKVTKMEVPPKALLESGLTEIIVPEDNIPSCPGGATSNQGSYEAVLTQKLRSLELQKKDPDHTDHRRMALDPSCLLTPPNTPQNLELGDPEADQQELDSQLQEQTTDNCQDQGDCNVDEGQADEVFALELQKGKSGLGLALVDGEETLLKLSGIYVKAVMPESPAALCQRLRPGDRILAVDGVCLVGLDYNIGREIIQKTGDRPRLLVARSKWFETDMSKL